MSHAVNPWSEASGFCYTLDAGRSRELLLVILLLPCHGGPAVLGLLDRSLPVLQQTKDGVDVGVD